MFPAHYFWYLMAVADRLPVELWVRWSRGRVHRLHDDASRRSRGGGFCWSMPNGAKAQEGVKSSSERGRAVLSWKLKIYSICTFLKKPTCRTHPAYKLYTRIC